MISTSVKLYILAALFLSSNVLCGPVSRSLKIIKRWDTYLQSNYSGSHWNGVGHYPINENDLDTERIFGGQFAEPHQFPFMAVVHRLMGGGMVSQCGGTIISHRWVLTAGHCVAPEPRHFLVVFSINDKKGIGYNFYNGPGISMMTDEGIVHPNFKVTINDIALLKMPRDIPFSETIQPIQLAGRSDMMETFVGKMGTVIGWGKDGPTGSGTRKLKYATIPIISNEECKKTWAITDKHVCTESGYGQDACQGDSGGPLIILENGVPMQIGLVSYGDGYCPSDKPGVFTRVPSFINWIQDVTGQHF